MDLNQHYLTITIHETLMKIRKSLVYAVRT